MEILGSIFALRVVLIYPRLIGFGGHSEHFGFIECIVGARVSSFLFGRFNWALLVSLAVSNEGLNGEICERFVGASMGFVA